MYPYTTFTYIMIRPPAIKFYQMQLSCQGKYFNVAFTLLQPTFAKLINLKMQTMHFDQFIIYVFQFNFLLLNSGGIIRGSPFLMSQPSKPHVAHMTGSSQQTMLKVWYVTNQARFVMRSKNEEADFELKRRLGVLGRYQKKNTKCPIDVHCQQASSQKRKLLFLEMT